MSETTTGPMGAEASRDVVRKLEALWRGIDFKTHWGEEAMAEFGRRCSRLAMSREQAFAALNELRMTRASFPDVAVVWEALLRASRAGGPVIVGCSGGVKGAWKETPEEAAAFERGTAEARAWAEGASGEEIAAARAELERRSCGWLRCPPTTRKELLANPGRCVSLYAAHRAGCKAAASPEERR
jgi:sugar phosphate isomerase/epimerase